jgi:hypothetical protein
MSPSGDAIAYDYICTNTGQAGGGSAGTEVYTAVTSGTSPGGAILEELRAARGYLPSWLPTKGGEFNDLLATDQYGRWLATLALSTPLEWTPVLEANEGYSFGGASFSRTGNVLVYQVGPEGGEESALVAARLNGTISPAAQITGQCVVATANGSMTPSVSPDGKRVAWSDAGGAKMATIEIPSSVTTSQCAGNTTTISPTGIDPVFSGAASPTNGGGGGGSSTGLSIKGPAKATLAQVRKGLTFTTRCSKKCTVKGTMTTGGKTVARATARLKRKGTAKVRLKARLAATVTEVSVVVSSAGKSATRTIPVSR